MPANIYPIFPKEPDVQIAGSVIGTSANTATDGTGANSTLLFTADATNGSYVYKVILKPISTIAATVARVFFCTATGSFTPGTTNTAANSALIAEVAITVDPVDGTANFAAGLPLSFTQADIRISGHAVECRLNAEDPDTFMPSPGTITRYHAPGGPGRIPA